MRDHRCRSTNDRRMAWKIGRHWIGRHTVGKREISKRTAIAGGTVPGHGQRFACIDRRLRVC